MKCLTALNITATHHHHLHHPYLSKPHQGTSHTYVACRSGCWWQWSLTDADQTSHWTLLVQGAAPCTGFQVMQSSNSSAHTTDITHMAIQLPDVSKQSLKQKMQSSFTGAADTEVRQTWLVRVSAPGVVTLWLDGSGASKAVEATVEVRNMK